MVGWLVTRQQILKVTVSPDWLLVSDCRDGWLVSSKAANIKVTVSPDLLLVTG